MLFYESFYGRVLHVSIRREACFSVGGGGSSFLSGVGGSPWGGALVLMGGEFRKKSLDGEGGAPPLWETPKAFIKKGLLEEME